MVILYKARIFLFFTVFLRVQIKFLGKELVYDF